MRVGLAFDLKPADPLPAGSPDDLHEEFDNPATIAALADAVRRAGHEPVELGDGRVLMQRLLEASVDLVLNIAEGTGTSRNREARVPAVCEMLGIPHTGSDVLTAAVCLDKEICLRLVRDAGVVVPKGILLECPELPYDGDYAEFPGIVAESDLTLPLFAKPTCEGSSKGIRSKCLIRTLDQLGPTIVELWSNYRQPVLLEEFIAGDEVTVGLLADPDPRVLGCMAIIPKQPESHFVYSLEVKRDWENRVRYQCPAPLEPAVQSALETAALTAFHALGIRDIARMDFRIRDGVPYFLEVNPLPGLNPDTGDIVLIAKAMGMSHADLIGTVIRSAAARSAHR